MIDITIIQCNSIILFTSVVKKATKWVVSRVVLVREAIKLMSCQRKRETHTVRWKRESRKRLWKIPCRLSNNRG